MYQDMKLVLKTSGAAEPDALAAALTALRLGDAAPAAAAGVACVGAACDLELRLPLAFSSRVPVPLAQIYGLPSAAGVMGGAAIDASPTDLLVQLSKAVHQLSQCQSADGQTPAL